MLREFQKTPAGLSNAEPLRDAWDAGVDGLGRRDVGGAAGGLALRLPRNTARVTRQGATRQEFDRTVIVSNGTVKQRLAMIGQTALFVGHPVFRHQLDDPVRILNRLIELAKHVVRGAAAMDGVRVGGIELDGLLVVLDGLLILLEQPAGDSAMRVDRRLLGSRTAASLEQPRAGGDARLRLALLADGDITTLACRDAGRHQKHDRGSRRPDDRVHCYVPIAGNDPNTIGAAREPSLA